MVKYGHRVFLLTGSTDSAKEKVRTTYRGVHVLRTAMMNLNWIYKRGTKGLEEETTEVFEEFIKTSHPDIIHCHNMHYFSEIHAQTIERIAAEKDIPLILTVHNVWKDLSFLRFTLDINWSHMIAVSNFIRDELIGVGVDKKKVTTVPHGVDTKLFAPDGCYTDLAQKYPILENKRIVFHPARMGLGKGCDVSIKALKLVRKKFPDVILVLSGTENIIDWGETQQKDIAYIIELAKRSELRDHILIDFFSRREMIKLYQTSSVCVYPSTAEEPFGIVVLEAMACAKPIIVTRSGGMPETVKNKITGFLIRRNDFQSMTSIIIQLLSDKKLCLKIGKKARREVVTRYTKEKATKNTLEVYKKVLASF